MSSSKIILLPKFILKLDIKYSATVTNSSRVCLSDEPDEYAERLRRISQVY